MVLADPVARARPVPFFADRQVVEVVVRYELAPDRAPASAYREWLRVLGFVVTIVAVAAFTCFALAFAGLPSPVHLPWLVGR